MARAKIGGDALGGRDHILQIRFTMERKRGWHANNDDVAISDLCKVRRCLEPPGLDVARKSLGRHRVDIGMTVVKSPDFRIVHVDADGSIARPCAGGRQRQADVTEADNTYGRRARGEIGHQASERPRFTHIAHERSTFARVIGSQGQRSGAFRSDPAIACLSGLG